MGKRKSLSRRRREDEEAVNGDGGRAGDVDHEPYDYNGNQEQGYEDQNGYYESSFHPHEVGEDGEPLDYHYYSMSGFPVHMRK